MLAFIPYVPPQPPSPRAMELGQRLAETVEQFRQQHPDLNRIEVAQAMQLAVSRAGGGEATAAPRVLILAVVGALLVGLFVTLAAGSGSCPARAPVVFVAVAIAAVALILVLLKRR